MDWKERAQDGDKWRVVLNMIRNVCCYKDWKFPDPLNAYQQLKENLQSILVVNTLVKECKPE